jgi:1-deoxy-D-xylulose-5-phosphate reductoisomerase
VDRFDFRKYSTLQFYEPDRERFTCLGLAYEAAKIGGSLPCFMNAANEVLVERFLKGLISWTDIAKKLESLMQVHVVQRDLGLEDILYVDQEAREEAFHA